MYGGGGGSGGSAAGAGGETGRGGRKTPCAKLGLGHDRDRRGVGTQCGEVLPVGGWEGERNRERELWGVDGRGLVTDACSPFAAKIEGHVRACVCMCVYDCMHV